MTRKKKRKLTADDFDTYEEFEEYQEQNALERKSGNAGIALPQPIIYNDAVSSFVDTHGAAPFPEEADEFYTIGDLRNIFAAIVPFGVPDAMPAIIETLQVQGYRLQYVPGFSEPVMPVKYNPYDVDEADKEHRYLSL